MELLTAEKNEAKAGTDSSDRRHIYGGGTLLQKNEYIPKGNRSVRMRSRSPFSIILALFIVSAMIVLYIWNKICVNRLAEEVNDLNGQYHKTSDARDFWVAEVTKKSGLERISKIASEKLGLVVPRGQPVWFEVDPGRMEKLVLEDLASERR